jgi:hypothetical protein
VIPKPRGQVRFLEDNALPYTALTPSEYDAVKDALDKIRQAQFGATAGGTEQPAGAMAAHYYKVRNPLFLIILKTEPKPAYTESNTSLH